jgi:hypothetical protein
MKSETKMRNRDLFMDMIRRPKDQKMALVWTGVSGLSFAVVLILELFK